MSKSKKHKFKIDKSRPLTITLVVFSSLLVLFLAACSSLLIWQTALADNRWKRLDSASNFCESLFDENSTMRKDTKKAELQDCSERLNEIENAKDETAKLQENVSNAFAYLDWVTTANTYIDENNLVKDAVQEKDILSLDKTAKALTKPYQDIATKKFTRIKTEYDAMQNARTATNSLFTSIDRAEVRPDVSRDEHGTAKDLVSNLKQPGLKEELEKSLEQVMSAIEERERIARELAEKARKAREEEERKIRESWFRLNISPYYINQFSSNILSGCEAASLLMALKYKGYLGGVSYSSFAANMPTSKTDPNQGFYLSMTDLEPRDEAHWIAPTPLANYGASTSGAAVYNVSGYSLDQLDNEVKNGNPVIIYMTFGFNNPKEYSKGVPRNLHVLVLAGFNAYTGEQQFYDPWPVNGNTPSLSKDRAEYLYGASGYRALVVR